MKIFKRFLILLLALAIVIPTNFITHTYKAYAEIGESAPPPGPGPGPLPEPPPVPPGGDEEEEETVAKKFTIIFNHDGTQNAKIDTKDSTKFIFYQGTAPTDEAEKNTCR